MSELIILTILFSTEDFVQKTNPRWRFATSSETRGRNSISFETQKYMSTLWIFSRWQKTIYYPRILQKWNTVEKIKGKNLPLFNINEILWKTLDILLFLGGTKIQFVSGWPVHCPDCISIRIYSQCQCYSSRLETRKCSIGLKWRSKISRFWMVCSYPTI